MRLLGVILIGYLCLVEVSPSNNLRQCGMPGIRRSGANSTNKRTYSSVTPSLTRVKKIARQNNRGNGPNRENQINGDPHGPNIGHDNGRQGPQNDRTPTEVFDPTVEELNSLDASRTEQESSMCTRGPSFDMDCNRCVCVGGMLYICTAKRCVKKLKGGRNILMAYHEKKVPECIEGEKVKSFDCNKCYCRGGHILCTRKGCEKSIARQQQQQCMPNDPVTSPDNCNQCLCHVDGQIYCTQNVCGIEPVKLETRNAGCVPKNYYSMTDNPHCKECYCIDGTKAFCHTGLCEESEKEGYNPRMLLKKTLPLCNPGAVLLDLCTRCICTYKQEWRCYTRMIDKCCDCHNNGQNNYRPSNPQQDRPNNPNQDGYQPQYPSYDGNQDHYQTQHPSYDDNKDQNPPPYSNDDNKEGPPFDDHNQYTTTEVYTTTSIHSDDDNDTPGGQKLGKCIAGNQFTQGMSSSCQGCYCGRQSSWVCYSHAGSCRGYNSKRCEPGELVKNINNPCSACYCGAGGEYMCAQDEMCSTTIKPSNCKALECEEQCKNKGMLHGYCTREDCKCAGGGRNP